MSRSPPDQRSPKSVWDEQHRLAATEPVNWMLKAESLMDAFEVLLADDERKARENLPGRRVQSVAYMIAGFAIETLLKGILATASPPVDKNGRITFKTHDLLKLAIDANFEVTEPEKQVMERLREYLEWAGRYPVPLTSEPMRPRPTTDGGFAPRTFHLQGADWDAIRELAARLRKSLQRGRGRTDGV